MSVDGMNRTSSDVRSWVAIGGKEAWGGLPISVAGTQNGWRRDLGPTHCQQFPLSLILIGPEAVSGLKSSLKKMRFVELIVREVTTSSPASGRGLQKRENIMRMTV